MTSFKDVNIIGLTGMSGAGKTTAATAFERFGLDVIDCDKVARAVITRSPCADEVRNRFPEIFTDGELNRKIAAKLLFSDPLKLEQYQKTVFPYVVHEIVNLIKLSYENGKFSVILDAPTLFQSGVDDFCGKIIAVVADTPVCVKRIIERDGISEEEVLMRLDNQPNADFFRKNADLIIENNGDINEFRQKIDDSYTHISDNADSGGYTTCCERGTKPV